VTTISEYWERKKRCGKLECGGTIVVRRGELKEKGNEQATNKTEKVKQKKQRGVD